MVATIRAHSAAPIGLARRHSMRHKPGAAKGEH
jgi:hypothetical protein